MIREVIQSSEVDILIKHLKKNVEDCLYMYIDLVVYGIDNPNMRLWIEDDASNPGIVIMKYHNSLQLYSSHDEWDVEGTLDIIEEIKPQRISGSKEIISVLDAKLTGKYSALYGIIIKNPRRNTPCKIAGSRECRIAEIKDIPGIAGLVLSDDEFGSQYTFEEFEKQMEERFSSGMGRSVILEDNGEIIGHMGTFAEVENIGILSGSVVKKEYRKTDAYNIISAELMDVMSYREGKDLYSFFVNKRMIKLYSKLFPICREYGKLTAIEE